VYPTTPRMSAYPPLPVNTQKVKSWGPKTAAARAIGAANAAPSTATDRQRRTRHTRNTSGRSVTAAVCLVSVASPRVAPAAAGRRRMPSSIAAVMTGSMNTSKLAACASAGRNAVAASR